MRSIAGGGQLTALVALVGVALFLWSTLPAGAQTSITLLSNTGQADEWQSDFHAFEFAQAFRTGSSPHGYTLTEIRLDIDVIGSGPSNPQALRARVCHAPADIVDNRDGKTDDGPKTASCFGTLSVPSSPADGLNSFSAGDAGIKLSANTTYFFRVDDGQDAQGGNAGLTLYNLKTTASTSFNAREAGWSMPTKNWLRSNNNDFGWFQNQDASDLDYVKMAMFGFANPAPLPAAVSPDPSNLARSDVEWEPVGGMHPVPARIGEITSNKPKDASASLDLSAITASVREELRERSRGFYVTTLVESPDERQQILRGLEHELARGSPLLKVNIWHVYRRASTGINTVELLGEVFLPRKVNLLVEPVEICLLTPADDAERARIAAKGRLDRDWTILETRLTEDGQLCAETTRVSWFVIVLEAEPESKEAAA